MSEARWTSPAEEAIEPESTRLSGQGIERREDAALLRGQAEFTDDLRHPEMAYLRFVRSDRAHAAIESIDTATTAALDGVLGVFTFADIRASGTPGVLPLVRDGLEGDIPGHPVLAIDRVRYHGQPVAAVVAEDPYRARDGAVAVDVAYRDLEPVIDPIAATRSASPSVHEGLADNVIDRSELGDEESTEQAFQHADHTVSLDLHNNRLIPSALEPRVALARYEPSVDRYTVELASQAVHGHRRKLSHTLGVPEQRIRVIAPSVGGGFGHKGHHHPGEAMAAWCARSLERPVKWTATRRGNYLEGAHGRDHQTSAEMALDEDGTIHGLRVDTHANVGGYGLGASLKMPGWYGTLLSSQYDIPAIHCTTKAVMTTTAPTHSYRGAGRPEAIYVTERLVDIAARERDIDPVELRRRNLIDPDAFPFETAVGATYDSGAYEPALQKAVNAIEADEVPHPADDRLWGIGVACYTESTGSGFESGVVRVHPDGSVTVQVGTHSHGQGHQTTYAQLVADELGVDYDRISVEEGDSAQIPTGTGTFGSRSTVVGGNAVVESAREVREKARRFAAHQLEVEPDEITVDRGSFAVRDRPNETVAFDDIAGMAYGRGVPSDLDPGLEATTFYEAGGSAYTFGTHAVQVAVDPSTGAVDIVRYVAVDDCGVRINPRIVDGQVHGGVGQGLGQARSERTVYETDGTLQTDTMLSYALPRAANLPDIETDATETPSPLNELGVKGIGEAGTIAAPPALVNAVVDALSPLGVQHVDMPLTDEVVLAAIADDGN